ncbi:MAG: TolC family protein [Bacteroidales bacterium]|nr:TolC family protein [Bacteroidales bacterium]
MRLLLLLVLSCVILTAKAQDTLSLFKCYQMAEAAHPLGLQKAELEEINNLNKKIITSSYLPQINLNGQATYQSDVVSIDLDIPTFEFPTPPLDQYKISLDVNQMIYDGGLTKRRKDLENNIYQTDLQKVEVDLYQIKDQVNEVFFFILILQENLKLLHLTHEILTNQLESVRSGVINGVLLKSDQYILEAELLKLDQNTEGVELSIESANDILEILSGSDLENKILTPPQVEITFSTAPNRPEHMLFQMQRETLLSSAKLKSTEKMPRLIAFGQFGYGKPGLNILNNEFDTYYMAGLTLSWNLWDWQKIKNERQVYKVQTNVISSQQLAFDRNLEIALTKERSSIEKLEKDIEKDLEIIELQKKILKSVSAQLDNGVITSTEYIAQLNAVKQTYINLNTHQLQLIQAKIQYQTILGDL